MYGMDMWLQPVLQHNFLLVHTHPSWYQGFFKRALKIPTENISAAEILVSRLLLLPGEAQYETAAKRRLYWILFLNWKPGLRPRPIFKRAVQITVYTRISLPNLHEGSILTASFRSGISHSWLFESINYHNSLLSVKVQRTGKLSHH